MSEISVSYEWSGAEPDIYYFTLAVDDPVTHVHSAIPLVASSVVVVEILVGVNWTAQTLEVAEYPPLSDRYAIRTTVPPALANGQERTLRITIDGVLYGPWIFRFYGV